MSNSGLQLSCSIHKIACTALFIRLRELCDRLVNSYFHEIDVMLPLFRAILLRSLWKTGKNHHA